MSKVSKTFPSLSFFVFIPFLSSGINTPDVISNITGKKQLLKQIIAESAIISIICSSLLCFPDCLFFHRVLAFLIYFASEMLAQWKSYFSLVAVLLASVLSSIFAIRVPLGGKS